VNSDLLSLGKDVLVGEYVRGVSVLGNGLVVTYVLPDAVEVIAQEGKRIHRLDNTSFRRKLFDYPEHVAVSSDSTRVFIADWNTIIMLSDQLKLLATFRQTHL